MRELDPLTLGFLNVRFSFACQANSSSASRSHQVRSALENRRNGQSMRPGPRRETLLPSSKTMVWPV